MVGVTAEQHVSAPLLRASWETLTSFTGGWNPSGSRRYFPRVCWWTCTTVPHG